MDRGGKTLAKAGLYLSVRMYAGPFSVSAADIVLNGPFETADVEGVVAGMLGR